MDYLPAVEGNLSLEALGLLVWISHQEKNFNITVRSLAGRHNRCKDKVSKLLDELIESGMLERSQSYIDGKMHTQYRVLLTRTRPDKKDDIGIQVVKSSKSNTRSKSLTIRDAQEMRPESISKNDWDRYWEYRWEANKPKTAQTIKLNTNVMLEAQKQGVLTDLLDAAIGNGWQGLQKKYVESMKAQAFKAQAIDNQFRGVE